jgi:hypothetical protein
MMRVILFGVLALVLAACTSGGGAEGATSAVETYLTATVGADADTLAQVVCAEREAEIEAAARRFATVSGAEIEGMACTFNEAAETVSCEGEIIATYGTENQSFPLGTYSVVQEDGEWKWCGEAQGE